MQHSEHRRLYCKKNSNIHWENIKNQRQFLSKKILAAWIIGKRKNGAPQFTCNNNFGNSIQKILSFGKALINKQALLREWMPLVKDQASWMQCTEDYFESCRNIDYQDEKDTDEKENEN